MFRTIFFYFQVIESTGVSAVGVHGRTKDQRPNNENNVEVLQEVVKHCKIPVIANGGSANTRDSPINTYEGKYFMSRFECAQKFNCIQSCGR